MGSLTQLVLSLVPLLCLIDYGNCDTGTTVHLPNGIIEGGIYKTPRKHVQCWYFLGIPYAAPPIGNNRFKPPQPAGNWKGVRNGKSHSNICYQTGTENNQASEDCLYLNVYTPQRPGSAAALPVLVEIHGGTFRVGSAVSIGGAQFLLDQNVIVVAMNYRLGPFGFLSTGDKVIPANMGLKDQQYAMKWVKQNIHLFGGDPRKVTIMGQSAGGASVSYHMLSPSSAGLFRAAIGQSGSALNTWAYDRHAVETAYGIASMIDNNFHKNRTTTDLYALLMRADGKRIHAATTKYGVFAPVMEVNHEGAFITESMFTLAQQGKINKVPYLTGFGSEEGIIAAVDLKTWAHIGQVYDSYPKQLVDDDMYITDDKVKTAVGLKIKGMYTHGNFKDDLAHLTQYHSDNRYMRAPIRFADLISTHTNVWFYQFSYIGKMGGNKIHVPGIQGCGHGEDSNYFWATHASLDGFPATDIKVLDDYVGLVTNFAKYLNPTQSDRFKNISWPKVIQNHFFYLDIDKNLVVKQNPRAFSYEKWIQLYNTYAKKPLISF